MDDNLIYAMLNRFSFIIELPLWKTFRWEEWAIEKGILPPKEDDTPLWFIKIVDFLRQICETEALKPSTLPPISGSDEKEVPQFWSDLHKLGKNLSHIIIYFKPSEFKINITVTNLVPSTEQMKPPFDAEHRKETIGWPNKVRLSKNEPLYIFTDSISEKFVVMALSHESARLPYSFNEEYQISDWDSHCDIFRSKSAITAEKYLWNQFKIGSVMFKISTVGTSCQLFNFNKGRILLALWIRSSTSYVLNILSDSRLIVGKWNLITDQLKSEAQQMVLFSNNLSLAFSNLFGELGYENFQHALHSFYSSYKPDLKYDKSMSQYIHTDYVQAILRYIEKIFDKSTFELMKYAFKVLFLNPKIACSETEVVNAQHFYDAKNKAAVLIQAHVRSFLIRQLKKHHNVLDPVYKEVVQELQSVYDLCFKASIRIETTPKIIRIFFKYSHISDLGENYSLYPDLCNVVRVIPHNGIISNIGPDDWVPIALLSFICLEDDITLRIDLECQLPLTMLRVFNNDTLVEKRRITNSVLPSKYRKNKFGYTIYAYGWNNGYTLQSLDWKVNIIHQLTDHELVETGKSENYRYDLHGCYIPNVYNIICKAVIKIEKTALVIIRVHLSYDKAKFVLRCKTGSGKVLKEIKGFENITLSPLLLTHNVGSGDDINESFSDYLSRLDMKFSSSFGSHLDSPRKSASRRLVKRKVSRDLRSTSSIISLNKIPQTKISEGDLESTYYIEAYVLDDSWPLTANEWRQTQNAKLHSCRSFSPPIDSKDLAKPYWKLSVIATDHISVARNWQREIEIETMKTSWEQTDPGRFQRAAEIRHNFLSEMCTNNSDSDTMVTTVSSLPRVKSSLAGFNRKRSRLSYKGKSQELSISHTCVPDDENTPRTLLPEVEKSKSLPQIDLSLYIKQNPIYDEMKEMLLDKLRYLVTTEKVFLKDENDAKVEAEFREYAMEYNKRYQEYFREQTNKYMCNQFDSYDYLLNHSDYERGRSKLLMEEAYEVRTICIIKQLQDQFGPEVAAKMLGGSKKK